MRDGEDNGGHPVTVQFDEFGWESLVEEARARDVSVEDLVVHAVITYLAGSGEETFSRRHVKLPEDDC
jgi:hypothetical protein